MDALRPGWSLLVCEAQAERLVDGGAPLAIGGAQEAGHSAERRAWCLVRRDGATSEEAIDALIPDTPPDRVGQRFWHALGDLRSATKGPEDQDLDVLVKVGEHYQPAELDALFRLAALEEEAGRPEAAVDMLERATAHDHYAEEAYRRLMVLQAGRGRVDAVRERRGSSSVPA